MTAASSGDAISLSFPFTWYCMKTVLGRSWLAFVSENFRIRMQRWIYIFSGSDEASAVVGGGAGVASSRIHTQIQLQKRYACHTYIAGSWNPSEIQTRLAVYPTSTTKNVGLKTVYTYLTPKSNPKYGTNPPRVVVQSEYKVIFTTEQPPFLTQTLTINRREVSEEAKEKKNSSVKGADSCPLYEN